MFGHVYTGSRLWETFFVFMIGKNSIIAIFTSNRVVIDCFWTFVTHVGCFVEPIALFFDKICACLVAGWTVVHLTPQRMILSHTLSFRKFYLWMQKLCTLLKLLLWYLSLSRCSLISFEIVVGSLQRYSAMFLKKQPEFRDFSMYVWSSSRRSFGLPGIYLLMIVFFLLLSEGNYEHNTYDMKE